MDIEERQPIAATDYHGVVSMYSSQAVTWENAIADVLQRAGEAFAQGRDSEAKVLRDLARSWEKLPEQARERQETFEREHRPDDEE